MWGEARYERGGETTDCSFIHQGVSTMRLTLFCVLGKQSRHSLFLGFKITPGCFVRGRNCGGVWGKKSSREAS